MSKYSKNTPYAKKTEFEKDVANGENTQYPKLSLEFLNMKLDVLQKDERLNIFKNLSDILRHKWSEIVHLGKHAIGFEMIPVTELKCPYPKTGIFANIDKATVFHKHGDDVPLIGFRFEQTYYLFCVDRDYKAYNH